MSTAPPEGSAGSTLPGDDSAPRAGLSSSFRELMGRAFRLCRVHAGMSQCDAAKELGVSNVHLCNVERGHTGPSLALCFDAGTLYEHDPYIVAARLMQGVLPFGEDE